MLDKYKYTEKEQKQLLSSLGIIVDTREKSNKHITDWFDDKNIKYKKQKLDQGDYSFYIPKNEELNIDRDIYFNKEIVIERKASLDEIALNMTKGRKQLKHEFSQHKGKMTLLIENANYEDICKGNYRSKYNISSFVGSLHSMSTEFTVPFIFIPDKKYTPIYIYFEMYYYFRNYIK